MTRYEYTGREKNAATGLLHYRNREYDAEQGKFLTEDPAGMQGSGTNLYAYVGNNPLSFNDPFGLSWETFVEGLKEGIGDGIKAFLIGAGITAGLAGLAATTGGAIVPAAIFLLRAYGLVSLMEEVYAIAKMFTTCPDDAHRRLGRFISSSVVSMVLGYGVKKLGSSGGGTKPCAQCFVGGTEVQLVEGTTPIEAIQLNDVVLSADQVAALDAKVETKPQNTTGKVSQLFSRMAPAVLDIALGSDKITVTPEHEFWVIGEGWKEAKELWIGAKLLTKDGKELRVEWIGKRFGEFRVYNFSVPGTATYFVGKTGVLVHNCNSTPPPNLTPTGAGRKGALNRQRGMLEYLRANSHK